MRPPSEHRMAVGWEQQGVQLPEAMKEAFRAEAAARGHTSVKALGTIAVGLLLGMPEEVRTAMFLWTQNKIAKWGAELTPEEIYKLFESMLSADQSGSGDERLARLLVKALRGDADIPPTERTSEDEGEDRKGV